MHCLAHWTLGPLLHPKPQPVPPPSECGQGMRQMHVWGEGTLPSILDCHYVINFLHAWNSVETPLLFLWYVAHFAHAWQLASLSCMSKVSHSLMRSMDVLQETTLPQPFDTSDYHSYHIPACSRLEWVSSSVLSYTANAMYACLHACKISHVGGAFISANLGPNSVIFVSFSSIGVELCMWSQHWRMPPIHHSCTANKHKCANYIFFGRYHFSENLKTCCIRSPAETFNQFFL